MSKNKVLITGGAGFIGSNLVNSLHKLNYDIVVMDNLSPQIHGVSQDSYTFNSIKSKCTFIKGDVTKREDWKKALTDVNIVIHLAAETGTGQSMYETSRYVNSNCLATSILTDFISNGDYNFDKIIIASSRAIYGEGKYSCSEHGLIFPETRKENDLSKGIFDCLCPECNKPLIPLPTDESSRINPLSVYGLTKYFQENLLLNVCRSKNVPLIGLRFQNVYGPGQSLSNPYTGIISIFSNRIRQNKDIIIFEDGKESRDFIFIDDVIDSLIKSINYPKKDQLIFNVGSGKMTSVLEIAQELKNLLNSKINIEISGQYRKGDIRHNYADTRQIQSVLNFETKIDTKEGLIRFIEWAIQQDKEEDRYESSLLEMTQKGLLKK